MTSPCGRAAARLRGALLTIAETRHRLGNFRSAVEIAADLHRFELTELERSDHIAEWIRLTEQKIVLDDGTVSGGRGNEGGGRGALEQRPAVQLSGCAQHSRQQGNGQSYGGDRRNY